MRRLLAVHTATYKYIVLLYATYWRFLKSIHMYMSTNSGPSLTVPFTVPLLPFPGGEGALTYLLKRPTALSAMKVDSLLACLKSHSLHCYRAVGFPHLPDPWSHSLLCWRKMGYFLTYIPSPRSCSLLCDLGVGTPHLHTFPRLPTYLPQGPTAFCAM